MRSGDRSGDQADLRVGVVLPVHNEERHLPAALRCLGRAMGNIGPVSIECRLVVALDQCTDRSADVVRPWCEAAPPEATVEVVSLGAKNVGLARRAGCAALMEHWSANPAEGIWLATTDADSEVPPDWLTAQVRARAEGAHIWVGRVDVRCWDGRVRGTADAWARHYAQEYLPVHGANFGMDAATYLRAGGFEGKVCGEDRALLERALAHGAVARADASVRVTTSGRPQGRAPQGFAHALSSIERSLPITAVAS